MPEEKPKEPTGEGGGSRFPDLEELQQEIEKRIRDNQRFLEGFLDEEFVEAESEEDEDDSGDDFEEL